MKDTVTALIKATDDAFNRCMSAFLPLDCYFADQMTNEWRRYCQNMCTMERAIANIKYCYSQLGFVTKEMAEAYQKLLEKEIQKRELHQTRNVGVQLSLF